MVERVLQTKVSIPPARSGLVHRKHLVERLNRGLQSGARFTLISAPAGFGKTTLAREWLSTLDQPVAWLSLDEEDGDPVRFLAYLIAALQTIHAELGQDVLSEFQTPQPPPLKTAVTALINDVATLQDRLFLVLDDYHLITTSSVHEALAYFLERQPPQLHLVLTTREDPPIPLPRWRARRGVTEVREGDLQFTAAETTFLLNDIMKLALRPEQIELLGSKTEGWISGLQLAALSLRGQPDVDSFVASFAGSNRYILDYLIEEVFRQQPADVQAFLLETAILEQLSAPLCEAVVSTAGNAQAMLERLEQANLFIVPLDETREWFRYHHLFADLLRQRLRVEQRDTAALHRRAGDWHEANGFRRRAINHYLAAPDWDQAAALIRLTNGELQKRGENATFLRWMELLPDAVTQANPALCLDYAWSLALNGRLDEADRYLQYAEAAFRDEPEGYATVLSAQIHLARIRHDLPKTINLSRRALSLMPSAAHDARGALLLNLGIAHWQSGQTVEAEAAFAEAQEMAQRAENHHVRLLAVGFLGMVLAARGHLQKAADWLDSALGRGADLPASALPYLVLGALSYEWNQLAEADAHLQKAVALARRSGNKELEGSALRQWALLKQARNEPAGALKALAEAEHAVGDDAPPTTRARNVDAAVALALAQNNLEVAQRQVEQMPAPASASLFYAPLFLAPARLCLAQGDKKTAAALLASEFNKADRAGWRYGKIEIRLLQALAEIDVNDALSLLADALMLAAPERFTRAFLDKGTALVPLLHMAASQRIAPETVNSLLAAFSGNAAAPLSSVPDGAAIDTQVEAISEREIEVLQLLAAGNTYREIAQTMVISVNTVKSHLKTIYGKLGVHNRREAVARARVLHLIPSDR